MVVKGCDIKVGDVYQRSGYTIEILEIISNNDKTITVRTKSMTKNGHSQIDVTNIRKSTNLRKIN